MSGTEKFLFLGAVTLASLVMSQAAQDSAVLASNTALTLTNDAPLAEAVTTPPVILAITPSRSGFLDHLGAFLVARFQEQLVHPVVGDQVFEGAVEKGDVATDVDGEKVFGKFGAK